MGARGRWLVVSRRHIHPHVAHHPRQVGLVHPGQVHPHPGVELGGEGGDGSIVLHGGPLAQRRDAARLGSFE